MSVCGTPDEEFMKKITSEEARNYIKTLPPMKKRNLKEVFENVNPDAINLLEKMLELDADRRPTAEKALAHKYLSEYADITDEPTADAFDDSFEEKEMSTNEWKKLVYDETISFLPQF